jgi:hypothetical protein
MKINCTFLNHFYYQLISLLDLNNKSIIKKFTSEIRLIREIRVKNYRLYYSS